MKFEFTGEVWHWRGPAPFYFVSVPEVQSAEISDLAAELTYGWGMIPVDATIGRTTWYTAMFAKDGGYVLPLKAAIRKAESIELGDEVVARIELRR